MTPHRTINTLLALLIAMGLSTSYLLDGPDDIATAQAVADDLKDATKTVATNASAAVAKGQFGHKTTTQVAQVRP